MLLALLNIWGSMQRVRLYGKGAAIFHYGKDVIRAENGVIDLPALLVPQALAMGFTTQPTGPDEIAKLDVVDVPPMLAGKPSIDDRIALYEKEARDAGYSDDAVAKIVQERLRYDELIASGMTEDDAVAAVWGPKTGDLDEGQKAAIRAELEATDTGTDPRIAPPVIPTPE
jgi:hypothetical protein